MTSRAQRIQSEVADMSREVNARVLKEALDKLEPISMGGQSLDAPWSLGLPKDAPIEDIMKCAAETLLELDGIAFAAAIDSLQQAMEDYKAWAEVTGFGVDQQMLEYAAKIKAKALTTKYSALILHCQRENALEPLKLRRMAVRIRSSLHIDDAQHLIMPQISELLAKMRSFKK